MILRRQSNCFQRSHSTIAVSFFQEYKRHISGFCLSSSGQFGRRNNWVHIIGSGKSNRRADIFKNCHVCQTNLGKMENYAISNFSQICHCFSLKANSTHLSFLARIDFWQKKTAFHLSIYSERSLIPMVLSCMVINWKFLCFFFFFRTYTPYISIFIIPCKIIQKYSWIVEIPSLNSYVSFHTNAPHLRSTTCQESLSTL